MPDILDVIPEPGGEFEYGPSPRALLRFVVRSSDDKNQYDVYSALLSETELLYDLFGNGLFYIKRERVWFKLRTCVREPPDLISIWEATVSYGTFPATGDSVYTFEAGGATRHVTQSLETLGRYAPPNQSAPDHEGAIGVSENGNVEGVDVPCSRFNWSETHYVPAELVTPGYRLWLGSVAGHVNEYPWGMYPAGTVLFRYALGSQRGLGDYEIAYHFSFSPDVNNLLVGRINVDEKPGWAYLWTQYQTDEDANAKGLARRPRAAYVEKIFDAANFANLIPHA